MPGNMENGSGPARTRVRICRTIEEMRSARAATRRANQRVGLVPTMGALHEGHLSLVRAARSQCGAVVVSIFVNPLQFGPHEDLAKYPRHLEQDCALLERERVDLVFAPAEAEMYPPGAMTYVTVDGLSERLCGRSRPGHFRGVATVVNKLFHIVEPEAAYFGQKDAAQAAVLRRMVRDLDMPVEIVVGPIVREADGLAMSSRNAYLDAAQRRQALVLRRSLQQVEMEFARGEQRAELLIAAGKRVFQQEPAVRLDYFEIVSEQTLLPMSEASGALVAVAAWVGTTRLIDNIVLQ